MKKKIETRGRKPLPEGERRIRVVVFPMSSEQNIIAERAQAKQMTLGRFMIAASLNIDPAKVL